MAIFRFKLFYVALSKYSKKQKLKNETSKRVRFLELQKGKVKVKH